MSDDLDIDVPDFTDDVLDNAPAIAPPMEAPPPLLAMHIAEYEVSKDSPLWSMEEIAEHFDLTVERIEQYKLVPSFRADVRACIAEIQDSNAHIRRKAAVQLEHYIDNLVPAWLADDACPFSEKVKLMAFLAKTGKLIDDPTEKLRVEAELAKNQNNNGGSFQPVLNVSLNLTSPDEKNVVIEQEKLNDE